MAETPFITTRVQKIAARIIEKDNQDQEYKDLASKVSLRRASERLKKYPQFRELDKPDVRKHLPTSNETDPEYPALAVFTT